MSLPILVAFGIGVFDVKCQVFLGQVSPYEMEGKPVRPVIIVSGKITNARTLDLDNPRAQVRQLPAGKVGRNGMPQGENSYPVEGTHQNDLGRSRTCSAI